MSEVGKGSERDAVAAGEAAAFAYAKTGGGPIGVFLAGLAAYRSVLHEHQIDDIERLKKERDYAVRWANRSVDSVKEDADYRIGLLRKALKPFADASDAVENLNPEWGDNIAAWSGMRAPTMGELRAAKRAIGAFDEQV